MALVNCPDCGKSISAAAPACIHCGRPMTAQIAAADSMAASPVPTTAAPPTPDDLKATGWILWRGERQFGPMSGYELADYFRSKMAIATDAVTGPAWPERVPAAEAADLLQVPRPLPAPATDPARAASSAMPSNSPIYVERVVGMSPIVIAVWLVVLLALQLQLSLHTISLPVPSTAQLIGSSLARFALIALACFGVLALLGKLIRGQFPGAVVPLFAMTVVYGVLFGKMFLAPAPQSDSTPLSATAATANDSTVASASTPDNSSQLQFTPAQPIESPPANQPLDMYKSVGHKDWYGFAKALEAKRDWQGLVNLGLEWAINDPQNPGAWVFQGIGYEGLGQQPEAAQAYRQATVLTPNEAYVWNNLSNVQLNMRQFADSEATSRHALEVDGNSAIAWNNLGAALQGENNQDGAMEAYQHALSLDQNYSIAWGNLGTQYYKRKQWGPALDAYKKALALDPSNQYSATGIANVLQMQRLGQ